MFTLVHLLDGAGRAPEKIIRFVKHLISPGFVIDYIDLIPNAKINTVTIYDGWQNLVCKGTNYDNTNVAFTGVSSSGGDLPGGVYFYHIEFASGKKRRSGFISLRR